MITEVIRFNNWEAFFRAVDRVKKVHYDKQVHGEILIPNHYTFKTTDGFNRAVAYTARLAPKNHMEPTVYGEIYVEVTDPWLR